MRNTYAEINFQNLKYNLLNIKNKVNNKKILAVVKADAYGHGAIECVKALNECDETRPDYLGVAILDEAIELRNAGIKQPILVFSPIDEDEIEEYVKYDLIATIFDSYQVRFINKYQSLRLKVHVKFDTGMGRIGVLPENAIELFEEIYNSSVIVVDGVYTHFACSDDNHNDYTFSQIKKFSKIISELKAKFDVGIVHAANSGAILDYPESYYDMVRPGVILYGNYPTEECNKTIELKQVMSLVTKVATIRKFEEGLSVSYGRRHITSTKTKIASLPLGYADGINRKLTNNIKVIINDKLYKQVGTICMDRFMVDIRNDEISIDDKVILFGKSETKEIRISEWCKILSTIPYEITCSISKRVKRVYIK